MNGRDDSVDAGEELFGQPGTSGRRRLALGVAAALAVGGVTSGRTHLYQLAVRG